VASDAAGPDADGKTAAEKFTDQRCKTGGWGDTLPLVTFGGVTLQVPDPVTSWTEMKTYQARTGRNVGISCIGRYEKVFRPGSAENMMLLASGGEWEHIVIDKCDRDKGGQLKNCTTMTLKEYKAAGSPANDASTVYTKQTKVEIMPKAWRGYMSAANAAVKFPAFGGGSASTITGLDNAVIGDIILLPDGSGGKPAEPGLAKLAMVINTNLSDTEDCNKEKKCYVEVQEPDNGKWPDSCGTTDTTGEMKIRKYYKPTHLPDQAVQEYKRIQWTSDCIETKITQCEQSAWNTLKIYRIQKDVRKGCDKDKAIDCTETQ
jgi:hypothetical protein